MTAVKVAVGTDDGTLLLLDALKFGAQLWLVPEWTNLPCGERRRPKRMIRIDTEPYHAVDIAEHAADYMLLYPIPYARLFGSVAPERHNYVIVENLDIDFPRPGRPEPAIATPAAYSKAS